MAHLGVAQSLSIIYLFKFSLLKDFYFVNNKDLNFRLGVFRTFLMALPFVSNKEAK